MLSEDAWNNMRTSTHPFFVWMHMHARKCSQWVWTHSKLCLYSCFLYSTLILDLRFILMCTWCHKTREGGVLENQGYSSSRVFFDFHWEFISFPFILISIRDLRPAGNPWREHNYKFSSVENWRKSRWKRGWPWDEGKNEQLNITTKRS